MSGLPPPPPYDPSCDIDDVVTPQHEPSAATHVTINVPEGGGGTGQSNGQVVTCIKEKESIDIICHCTPSEDSVQYAGINGGSLHNPEVIPMDGDCPLLDEYSHQEQYPPPVEQYPHQIVEPYPPTERKYPPPEGPCHPTQGAYPPTEGPSSLPERQQPPPEGPCPSTQGAYPPTNGTYAPTEGEYPLSERAYPPTDGTYAPTEEGYPPTEGGYPPTEGAYPPTEGAYPPTEEAYPPTERAYPPTEGPYSLPVGSYPPTERPYIHTTTDLDQHPPSSQRSSPLPEQKTYSPAGPEPFPPPADYQTPEIVPYLPPFGPEHPSRDAYPPLTLDIYPPNDIPVTQQPHAIESVPLMDGQIIDEVGKIIELVDPEDLDDIILADGQRPIVSLVSNLYIKCSYIVDVDFHSVVCPCNAYGTPCRFGVPTGPGRKYREHSGLFWRCVRVILGVREMIGELPNCFEMFGTVGVQARRNLCLEELIPSIGMDQESRGRLFAVGTLVCLR